MDMVRGRWFPGAVLLLAACEGGGTGSHLDAPPWTVAGPEVRIGAVDDPAYAFSFVRALSVGPTGRVFSLHLNDASVRVWSPDGKPAGSIGRQGDGPGEFQNPISLGFFGDTLWVMDLRAYRASYFTADGSFLGNATPKVDLGSREVSPPRPERPLRDGTWFGAAPAFSDGIARGTITQTEYVHMDGAGALLDTVWVQQWRPTDILALLNKDGRGGSYSRQPFGDRPLFQVMDDGGMVVVEYRVPDHAEGATFSVMRLSVSGDTLWRRALPYSPVPLDPARANRAADSMAEERVQFFSRMRPGLTQAGLTKELRDAMYAPPFEPFLRGLVVASDGSIWLQRYGATADGAEWWVLDEKGQPLGRAFMPDGLRVVAIRGDDVWGVETDDMDVSYIIRYRVDRGTP